MIVDMTTLAQLYAPTPRTRLALFMAPLTAAIARYGIGPLNPLAAFLATVGHESEMLTRLSENLNYSAQGLADTWPERYAVNPKARVKAPNALAEHAYRLSQAFSKFYSACPILAAPSPELRASRLTLAQTVLRQLELALELLGIATPERM